MAIEKPGPQNFTAKAEEVRSCLGLSNPEAGDELIGGVPAVHAPNLPGHETGGVS
jgi:hypothetical protein